MQIMTHDGETLDKVYAALAEAGLDESDATNAVNELQNAGIYFREVKHVDHEEYELDDDGHHWGKWMPKSRSMIWRACLHRGCNAHQEKDAKA